MYASSLPMAWPERSSCEYPRRAWSSVPATRTATPARRAHRSSTGGLITRRRGAGSSRGVGDPPLRPRDPLRGPGLERDLLLAPGQQLRDPQVVLGLAGDGVDPVELL